VAQPYLDRLEATLREANPSKPRGVRVECKHFFSGAALYANGRIFASLTPSGLAIKLSEPSRATLVQERRGRPLRYFKGGPIKQEYVVLSRKTASDREALRELLRAGIRYVTR
jgi:TfoX/Sxy family transcriptional regulator of competence genes